MKRPVPASALAGAFLAIALCLAGAARARAQSTALPVAGAALAGSVHDASGAAIPRPTIVVRHEQSGLESVTGGGADGSFAVRGLSTGAVVVTISAPGFASAERHLEIPRATPLTVTLSPAPIVEQVTVVSASRQEELREALNTRVDVVTRNRIDETGGLETVGEILRELPGVVTRQGSETAGSAGEQVQGIDSRQVLVLLDGQPIAGARGIKRGGIINLDRQSTARLERVEVVKGAASALYGSDALGGVINLITREPGSPFDVNASASRGSFGAMDAAFDSGFKRDRTFGIFSVERHEHGGFDLTPGTFDTTGAPYLRYDALAKARYHVTPSFSLGGFLTGYRNRTTGRSNGELGPQEDDVRERALSLNVAASWLAGTSTTIEARGYLSTYAEEAAGRLAPPRSTPLAPGALDQRIVKTDVSLQRTIGSRQVVQAGLEWSRDHYEGTNRLRDEAGGDEADTAVAWAQHRWSATSRLTTTLGLRVDHRSPFETAVSPKAGATYRLTDSLRARASYGRGFRAPDLGQLYYRFLSPSNMYQVVGSPALRPELADSWQFGGEYTFPRRRARVGVNVFRNDVQDLIESINLGFVATPDQLSALLAREGLDPSFRPVLGRLLLTYRNIADIVTEGLELDAEAALTETVSVGGAYTFLSARDAGSDRDLTGRHRHHGSLRLAWQPARTGLRASVRGTFFSSWIAARAGLPGGGVLDTIAPRFALWDAVVLQRLGGGLAAFVSLDNLTDSQDPNTGVLLPSGAPAAIYRPDAGRAARVGVRWSFSAK
ncbi:MAG: TonB-dependent receptor [Acidobacteria bacterium]|nr:TonB-dependent receptor [Acidobacteriota bacterium]